MEVVIILIYFVLQIERAVTYDVICPDHLQRRLRAAAICKEKPTEQYSCLQDLYSNNYVESCSKHADYVRPGEKYVVSGLRKNTNCSSQRYQPFIFWSFAFSNCAFKRSTCSELGQVLYRNGSTQEDNSCKCDYTKGYAPLVASNHGSGCTPSSEDCACYYVTCDGGRILSPEYDCKPYTGLLIYTTIDTLRSTWGISSTLSVKKDQSTDIVTFQRSPVIKILILITFLFVIISTVMALNTDSILNMLCQERFDKYPSINAKEKEDIQFRNQKKTEIQKIDIEDEIVEPLSEEERIKFLDQLKDIVNDLTETDPFIIEVCNSIKRCQNTGKNVCEIVQTVWELTVDIELLLQQWNINSFTVKGMKVLFLTKDFFQAKDEDMMKVMQLLIISLEKLWTYHRHIIYCLDIDTNLRSDVDKIIREFRASDDWLKESKLSDPLTMNIEKEMTACADPFFYSFLGKLKTNIESNLANADEVTKFLTLYIRMSFLRSTMLTRICYQLFRINRFSEVSVIRSIQEREYNLCRDFLSNLFEKPTYDNATFLAVFKLSEHTDIVEFAKGHKIVFQNLKEFLHKKRFSIRPRKWKDFWVIMSNNWVGTLWSTNDPVDEISLLFEFVYLPETENLFHIRSVKWPSWYVTMKKTASLRGKNKKGGKQRMWKIIRLVNGEFMICSEMWPGKFIKMKAASLGEIVADYGDPGPSGYWLFDSEEETHDRFLRWNFTRNNFF